MKLSYKTTTYNARTFLMLMWVSYNIDLGNPVIMESNKIRQELENKYGVKFEEITENLIYSNIKCIAKLFTKDNRECWSRIPSNVMVVLGTYYLRSNIDLSNLKEYVIQNLESHNHRDKIPTVLSEIENVHLIINESIRRFENGIKFDVYRAPVEKEPEISLAKKIMNERNYEIYTSLSEGRNRES